MMYGGTEGGSTSPSGSPGSPKGLKPFVTQLSFDQRDLQV